MADNDNKGGDGKGGDGSGDRRMTADEIAAAAAAAKKLLDEEKNKGGGGDGGDKGAGGDKPIVDEDPNKDRKDGDRIDIEKTLSYVDKLKDENAKRRIDNKKLSDRLDKTEKQLQDAAKALEEATKRIKEADTATETEAAKKRTDLENASKRLDELTKTVNDLQAELKESKANEAKASRQVRVVNRETMIERLVEQQGARFASDFERNGLIATLTKQAADGEFELNNDEVIYEVMKFIETAPKAGEGGREEPRVPGAGPGGRKSQTPVGDEIQALLAKKARLKPEERDRLSELLRMSSEAHKALNTRQR